MPRAVRGPQREQQKPKILGTRGLGRPSQFLEATQEHVLLHSIVKQGKPLNASIAKVFCKGEPRDDGLLFETPDYMGEHFSEEDRGCRTERPAKRRPSSNQTRRRKLVRVHLVYSPCQSLGFLGLVSSTLTKGQYATFSRSLKIRDLASACLVDLSMLWSQSLCAREACTRLCQHWPVW